MKDFLAQAAKLLKKNKQYRRQMVVFLCLAVVVTFGTVTALKLYGQAMTHQVEVLDCQYKVHEHTEECYDRDENGNLGTEPVCGYALYAIHTHNDACYDAKGNLVCALEEHEKHEHKEECYLTEKVLVCELEETEVTVPPEEDAEAPEETPEETEAPAGEETPAEGETPVEGENPAEGTPEAPAGDEAPAAPPEPTVPEGPICGKEPHTHGEGCYEDAIVCGFAEEHAHGEGCATQTLACTVAEHAHGDGCTDEEGNMTCTLEEHAHQEGCYTQEMTCGKEEHTHAEGCHARNLVCTLEEHEHIESCYAQAPAAPAQPQGSGEAPAAEGSGSLEECDETGEGHIHTEECYEEVTTLVCGELELHTHDDSCYSEECFDEEGKLIEGSRVSCGLLQLEEHIHVHTEGEDSCFKTVELTPEEVAALENGAKLHIHEDSCYDEEGNLICGHDANHVHMPQCYDDAGNLICGYGTAVHVHEAKCYDAEGNLICGYETASHVHEENCYDAEGNLQCGYETATHVHGKECYDEEGNLTCGYEAAAHVHEDGCYDAEGNLICGYGTVSDTEDTVTLDGTFTYEAEDYTLEIHVQTDVPAETQEPDAPVESTTDEETAGTEEKAESGSEAEAPSTEEGNSTTTEAESQPVTDDNGEESGEEPGQEASASGIEELSEVHEGDTDMTTPETEESQEGDVPEDTDPDEAEGQPEQGAQILIADEASGLTLKMSPLDAAEGIYAEMADYVEGIDGSRLLDLSVMELHVYRDGKEIDISDCTVAVNIMPKAVTTEEMIEAYGEEAAAEEGNGIIVSALQKTADGVRGSGNVFLTPDMAEIPVLQNAVAENGVLAIARYVNNETITKTFRGESFIVTATYKPNANIPAEAELLAEQITEESDSDHYAKRQEEYQEALGDETATMQALMKIGFYVEDENGEFTTEVEPESPVTITIQFLDEDGLAEGKPITVIHFAEDGTELLEGSKVEGGSTTFEMESFSEIAVGYGVENVRVPLDEAIDYETDAFHITFHIKGDVTVPFEGETGGTASVPEEGNPQPEADGAEGSESSAEEEESPAEPTESETGEEVQGNGEETQISGDNPEDEEKPDAESGDGQHVTGTTEGNVFTAPVESEVLDQDFEFKVESLDESSEEYAAVVAYGEEIGDGGEELLLQVWSYSLNYAGEEIDLSDCKVTAEITPTQALVDVAKEAAAMAIGEDSGEMDAPGEGMGEQAGFVISVMNVSADAKIGDIETTAIDEDTAEKEIEPTFITLETGTFAARASGQPNPKFTVQYYANLEKVAYNDASLKVTSPDGENTNEIPVIDTDGGKLPGNGKGTTNSPNENGIRKLYVDTATGKLKTKTELTEVYAARPFEYHKAPTINYINAVIESPSYELKEVWVLKEGKSSESTEKGDWDIYTYDEHLHFTNRELSEGVEDGETYVFIKDGAFIRLVYDTTSNDKDFAAAFYDYDISDGKIYANESNAQNGVNGKKTSQQGTTQTWYMRTGQQGINSPVNYEGSGSKLAFGNSNSGSGFQHEQWGGNLLNKHNGTQTGHPKVKGSYKGCTFGLATGLTGGKIQYANGVIAPKLFNDGAAAGKTVYDEGQYSLKFNRVGDTHTLTAVNGTATSRLDSFNNPIPYAGKTHYHIWTNNFWPMDSASSFGTDGHDMKFGDYGNKSKRYFAGQAGKGPYEGGVNYAGATGNFPESDDGKDHNSYFGMHYKVEFDLVADYVGPLEYYFFGDDDMWVFLGDENSNNGKLVCDIGGVHSSVGEYLNLWDYIDKEDEKIHRHVDECYGNGKDNDPICGYVDSKKFTLNFFYTERGESGSTCWMQFTLPSVSSLTPETTDDDFGHLEIRKTVKVTENGKDYSPEELFGETEQGKFFEEKEFEFTLKLNGPSGATLKDDYAYVRYDRNGNPVTDGSGILAWETIANGETFKLKDGEYIRIQFLPVGTTYTLIETDNTEIQGVVYSGTEVTVDSNSQTNGLEVSGTIPKNDTSQVMYTNKYSAFKLPETGGSGTILYTMAGGMALLFGAGFLYKKKFRERRG